MSDEPLKAEEYRERREEISGWPIRIVSYRIGQRCYCAIDNVDPGARLARGEGRTREEAETVALEKVRQYLPRTRRFIQSPTE